MSDEKKVSWKDKQKIAPRVEEGINNNVFLKSRDATKTTKKAFKESKKNYKLSRKKYKVEQRKYKNGKKAGTTEKSINPILAKKRYLEAKTDKKVAKKVYQRTKSVDGTRISVQAKLETKQRTKQDLKYKLSNSLREDDILGEGVEQYRKGKQVSQNMRTGFKVSKNAGRLVVKSGKGTYGLGNRFYNFSRGRGFQRTPDEFTARKQLMKRIRNYQQKLKVAKEAKNAERGLSLARSIFQGKKTMAQGAKLVMGNPITWIVLGIIIVAILIGGLVSSTLKPAIVQEEDDLTESWTYMTKLDAENSDTSNNFFSNIDDVMFYMNNQFEDYKLSDYATPIKTHEAYLTGLWKDLNGEPPDYSLKTMEELETDKESGYYIPTDDYKEYQELKDELGFSTLEGQLSFPYETEALTITRRYGYEREGESLELNKGIEASTNEGEEINAPMSGIISVLSDTSIQLLEENDARLTIEGVNSSRFKGGESISQGYFIGTAKKDHLTIKYEKYQKDQKKWISVNPGFYFPKVIYTQTTELGLGNFDPSADVAERAKFVYDYLTKMGYTKEGISAILGNFSVESSINPKRAEGDFLLPPVGASANSWDDPAWLSMGGLIIYGKYPNILHRGLGLGQWTDTADGSRRHTLLLEFAKSKNKKWYDLQLQLDFIFNGDSPGSRVIADNTAGSKVATTVPELTTYFLKFWEGNPGDKVTERIQAAQNWFNYFSGSSADLSASSKEVYEKYKDKATPLPTDKETKPGQGWPGNAYALGNCTWYVYNRMNQLGKPIHPTMGNAKQWVTNYTQTPGASLAQDPRRGDVAIFTNGVAGYPPLYGHVAIVEYVNSDGTFVISEMNINGEYSMGWRVLKKEPGMYFMRVN